MQMTPGLRPDEHVCPDLHLAIRRQAAVSLGSAANFSERQFFREGEGWRSPPRIAAEA
jgi:hypothetical protein